MRLNVRFLASILSVLGLLAALPAPAYATFPGKNGRIAFILGPDIYTMNSGGSDIQQLTDLGPNSFAYWESWSPDGKQIVFVEFNPIEQLWLMNADGSNQHLLLAEDNFNNERPSFSPDGSAIVFSRCTLDFEPCALYQIGVDGGGLKAITDFQFDLRDISPVYSPDGDSLVFASAGRRGIIAALYSENLKTKLPLLRLTPSELSAREADWSPDGERIAFSTHCCNPQNEEIWVVGPRGDGLRRLTNNGNDYFAGPHDFFPSWSPAGDAIVFERDAPDFSNSAIFVMKADGSGSARLIALGPARANQRRRGEIRGSDTSRRNRRLKQIEEDGGLPRWGPAPH